MAFRTRTGRVVAVGHGTMVLSQLFWWVVLLLLVLVALAQLLGATVLWVPEQIPWAPDGRPGTVAATINDTAAALMQLAMTFSLIDVGCGFTIFISATSGWGPQKTVRLRDYASAAVSSLTGRWFLFGALIAALLSVELQRPAETSRTVVSLICLGLLITVWIMVLRGIRRITATNRAQPYFSGLTDDQKDLAENPWPTRVKPTFPDPELTGSEDDAMRYARRAHRIARLHEWIGGGVIALSTAVLGAAVAQFFVPSGDVAPWITSIVALLVLALGYAIHRRGSQYNRLREQFEQAAAKLREETDRVRGGVVGWMRALLGL